MAVLNVSPTPQKKYVHQRNEPEIIEIFLRYITRTGRSDCFPPAYVGYLGFSPKCTVTNLIEEFLKTQSVFKNTSRVSEHAMKSFPSTPMSIWIVWECVKSFPLHTIWPTGILTKGFRWYLQSMPTRLICTFIL